jgi:hypothetical protein
MDPTAVLSQLKVKREDLTNQESSLVRQIEEATNELSNVRETRDKVDESIAQFNNILSMIAQQWSLPGVSVSAPVPASAPAPVPVPVPAEPQPEASKKTPKKTKTVVVQEAPGEPRFPLAPSSSTPAPVVVSVSKEAPPPAPVEAEPEADEEEGDVEVLEITQDGVTYVVFTDTNDVAEADDPDENIVGTWDPATKKIVFA